MGKTPKVANSSDLYTKIDSLNMSSVDRQEAHQALNLANRVVGAVAYLFGLVRLQTAGRA